MGKFIKQGKIVIILSGKYAGKKAVVIRSHDEGNKERKFGHALVAGIAVAPRKLTKTMSKEKLEKRSRVKPFVKFVNYTHLMPTRYNLDISEALAKLVSDDSLADGEKKAVALKEVKATLEDRFKNITKVKNEKSATGVQYFFKKLNF